MKREEYIKVYKDTLTYARNNTTTSYKQSENWLFSDLPPDEDLFDDVEAYSTPAEITVVNGDTLTTALNLKAKYPETEPLVLNMASSFCPGGGVVKGSRAQEEEIFRRSNYGLCTNRSYYPMKADSFIVTENVLVFKDEDYNVMHDKVAFDFIAMAAVRKPSLEYWDDGPVYMDPEDKILMSQKIDAIFRYAIYQGKDTLVLGALGCGAYGNPSTLVVEMFRECLEKYKMYFRFITFAVLSDTNSKSVSAMNFQTYSTLVPN